MNKIHMYILYLIIVIEIICSYKTMTDISTAAFIASTSTNTDISVYCMDRYIKEVMLIMTIHVHFV